MFFHLLTLNMPEKLNFQNKQFTLIPENAISLILVRIKMMLTDPPKKFVEVI